MTLPQRPQAQGCGRQGQAIVCYHCGKEGHYALACAATRDPSGSSAGTAANQTEQYTHPQSSGQNQVIPVSTWVGILHLLDVTSLMSTATNKTHPKQQSLLRDMIATFWGTIKNHGTTVESLCDE